MPKLSRGEDVCNVAFTSFSKSKSQWKVHPAKNATPGQTTVQSFVLSYCRDWEWAEVIDRIKHVSLQTAIWKEHPPTDPAKLLCQLALDSLEHTQGGQSHFPELTVTWLGRTVTTRQDFIPCTICACGKDHSTLVIQACSLPFIRDKSALKQEETAWGLKHNPRACPYMWLLPGNIPEWPRSGICAKEP